MKFEKHRDYNRLKVAFDLLANGDGTRILNVGCGKDAFLEQKFTGADIIGLDISPAALREAKKKAPHGHYLLADIRNLPIKDGSIDTLAMLAVLGGVPQSEEVAVFREASRILRNGGRLVILVSQKRQPYSSLAPDRLLGGWKWRHYNFRLLEQQLGECGFTTTRVIFTAGILSLVINMANSLWVNSWQLLTRALIRRPYAPPLPYRWINRLSGWEFRPFPKAVKRLGRFIYIVAERV